MAYRVIQSAENPIFTDKQALALELYVTRRNVGDKEVYPTDEELALELKVDKDAVRQIFFGSGQTLEDKKLGKKITPSARGVRGGLREFYPNIEFHNRAHMIAFVQEKGILKWVEE